MRMNLPFQIGDVVFPEILQTSHEDVNRGIHNIQCNHRQIIVGRIRLLLISREVR
jgi:hypothetical protein